VAEAARPDLCEIALCGLELCEKVRVVLCVCLLPDGTDGEGERHAFVLRVCYTVPPRARAGVMHLLDGNSAAHDAQWLRVGRILQGVEMTDDFDEALAGPVSWTPSAALVPEGAAMARPIPELVSEIYGKSPAPLRTKLLECLLRPVGPLALVAIATGAFSHLLHRLTRDASPISLDEAARITSEHVLELARYVEQCSPHELLRIGSLIAANPMAVATMGGSALLLALGAWGAAR